MIALPLLGCLKPAISYHGDGSYLTQHSLLLPMRAFGSSQGRGTTLSFHGRESIQRQAGGRLHNKLRLIWTKGNSANISIATGPDD
jgi:hypothetical protein